MQKSSFVVQFWYMSTLVKDTHDLINFLQKKGYSKEQAEGFVEAVKDFDTDKLATKDQLSLVITKINFLMGLNVAVFAGIIVLLLEKLFV